MDFPQAVRKYFWDTDTSRLDAKKHQRYIIGRILEYGDLEAAQWLLQAYSQEEIQEVLRGTRAVSPRSGKFWALFFHIPFSDLLCLKKSYRQLQKSHWNA